MPKTTEMIRYNLRERGRKHRGQERNFNIPALVRHINSPAVQEKVRMRDMHGYYGHWPRKVFGINPSEGGIVDGKVVHIEPAFITTHLKAYDDGTVEHITEFIDNVPGQAAAKLYDGKGGGWSSAIVESENAFYGFDYVFEPNFTHNRGYKVAMDSVEGAVLTLDDVEAYYDSAMEMVLLLDSAAEENQRLREQLDRANRTVVAMGATVMDAEAALDRALKRAERPVATLDSAKVPAGLGRGPTAILFDRAEELRTQKPASRAQPAVTFDAVADEYSQKVKSFWKLW